MTHCDAVIDDAENWPEALRKFVGYHRRPAIEIAADHAKGDFGPELYATDIRTNERVRVTMASRLGDIGVSSNLDAANGYERRVSVDDLAV